MVALALRVNTRAQINDAGLTYTNPNGLPRASSSLASEPGLKPVSGVRATSTSLANTQRCPIRRRRSVCGLRRRLGGWDIVGTRLRRSESDRGSYRHRRFGFCVSVRSGPTPSTERRHPVRIRLGKLCFHQRFPSFARVVSMRSRVSTVRACSGPSVASNRPAARSSTCSPSASRPDRTRHQP